MIEILKKEYALRRIKNRRKTDLNGVFVATGPKSNDWGVNFLIEYFGHLVPPPWYTSETFFTQEIDFETRYFFEFFAICMDPCPRKDLGIFDT